MLVLAAAEAKNNFGRMIDTAQREPITIEKKGRAIAVVLSMEEYSKLEALENEFWSNKAKAAIKEGFIGIGQSGELLQGILSAKD
ncbi:MAG: type II toxin-antitoxin system Phd/YefM family antitoxin [Pseudomonadota bacterium]